MASPSKPLSQKEIKSLIESLEYGKRILSDSLNVTKLSLEAAESLLNSTKNDLEKVKSDKDKFKQHKDVVDFDALSESAFTSLPVAEQRLALYKVLKALIKEL